MPCGPRKFNKEYSRERERERERKRERTVIIHDEMSNTIVTILIIMQGNFHEMFIKIYHGISTPLPASKLISISYNER